ncbi:MAG: hypothetical protein HOP11_11955 [Saprospiraceae bacterium]|nr:hypothetical protein [Saprospiraceae bacterium]
MNPKVKIIYVLISSPNDCEKEREIVSKALFDWNSKNSKISKQRLNFFIPLTYEEDFSETIKSKVQDGINEEVVSRCDIGIVLFKSKLGGERGRKSGTIQEIEYLLNRDKDVIIRLINNGVVNLNLNNVSELLQIGTNIVDLHNYLESELQDKMKEVINSDLELENSIKKFLDKYNLKIANSINEEEKGIITERDKYKISDQERALKLLKKADLSLPIKGNLDELRIIIENFANKLHNFNIPMYNFDKGVPNDTFGTIFKGHYKDFNEGDYGFKSLSKLLSHLCKMSKKYCFFKDNSKKLKEGNQALFIGKRNLLENKNYEEVIYETYNSLHSVSGYKAFLETKILKEIVLPDSYNETKEIFQKLAEYQDTFISMELLKDKLNEVSQNNKSIINYFLENGILIEKEELGKKVFIILKFDPENVINNFIFDCKLVLESKIGQKVNEEIFNKLIYS